jgi:hypothetical protein
MFSLPGHLAIGVCALVDSPYCKLRATWFNIIKSAFPDGVCLSVVILQINRLIA